MRRATLVLAALALLFGGVGQAKAGLYTGGNLPSAPGSPSGPDPMYTFTLSGPVTGYGTLTSVPNGLGDDGLWATGVSLTLTNTAYAGEWNLITTGPNVETSPDGGFVVDNLIYPNNDAGSGANNNSSGGGSAISSPSYLDNYGLLFGVTNGVEINIWGNGGGDYAAYVYDPSLGNYAVTQGSGETFSLSAVPEPASLTLLGTAGLSLAGFYWRRRQCVTA
jgi:hypothetical protein